MVFDSAVSVAMRASKRQGVLCVGVAVAVELERARSAGGREDNVVW